MIKHTFCHLPQVSLKTERKLWEKGFTTWEEVFRYRGKLPIVLERNLHRLHQSIRALERHDLAFFTTRLHSSQHWRLFKTYHAETLYLDIESYGLNIITCIGVFDGEQANIFIKGENLEDFPLCLPSKKILVTFNGKSYDVPQLRKRFGTLEIPPVHLDLRFILKDLGYMGGLKKIEQHLGIYREGEMLGMDGYFAVLLWKAHLEGDTRALPTLIRYNLEDVVNLEYLMIYSFNAHCKALGWGDVCMYRKPLYPLDAPFSPELVREIKTYLSMREGGPAYEEDST
jgi:uncharacterized protein